MLRDSSYHKAVLYCETLAALQIKPEGIYLDGTMGGAGHASGIYQSLSEQGTLLCLDRDPLALEVGGQRLGKCKSGAHLYVEHADYADFPQAMQKHGLEKLDGALLDIGVSSAQIDLPERGFSYMQDGPLDMRMDSEQELTAADVLNRYSEAELVRVLRDYGEERYAISIARRIVQARSRKALSRTSELCELIYQAIPNKARKEKQHPAKRSFQALRIEVNQELDQLESFLAEIPKYMQKGGRLAIITFHSLEDRLVKKAMRAWEDPRPAPPQFPLAGALGQSLGRAVPRKGICASSAEIADNPRARSARLRVFEFTSEDAA